MESVAFGWVGPSRARAVRAAARARLDAWRRGWLGEDTALELCATDSDGGAGTAWRRLSSGEGVAYVRAEVTDARALGQRLVGTVATRDAQLAERLGSRCLSDLLEALAGAPGVEQEGISPRLGRSRGVGVALECADVCLELHLDSALCDALVPRTRAPRTLARRSDAIGTLSADLNVVLDLGALKLGDVASLKPGDLLKSSVRVGSLVAVTRPDGSVVRTGQLAAANGHRAVTII